MDKAKLYIIPNLLGESGIDYVSENLKNVATQLNCFVVENVKMTRRFLRKLDKTFDIDGSTFFEINSSNTESQFQFLQEAIAAKKNVGLLSDAGLPGIADPGEEMILLAHQLGFQVVPLVGPSSIFLALAASGLNGEAFHFHGYLPIKNKEREIALKKLEAESLRTNASQIFIETPYRNNQMIDTIFKTLNPKTYLCLAADITLPTEFIATKTVASWKKTKIDLHKRPCVFVLMA